MNEKMLHILHLSDIHLGTAAQADVYRTHLETDLKRELGIKKLQYLVLSGDIANRSAPEEYAAALALADGLIKGFGLDKERIIIVPGNHDLNWDLSKKAYRFVYKADLPNPPPPEAETIPAGEAGVLLRQPNYPQRFSHFDEYFYNKIHGQSFSDITALIHFFPQHGLLFLCLNSCWQIDHHYTDRAGIDPGILAKAMTCLLDEKYQDIFKIALWHHPASGPQGMKNTDFLQHLAVHGFQLCLHGHVHEAGENLYRYDPQRQIHLVGAGTFGAPAAQQVPGIPLQYNLLALDPQTGTLVVHTRKKEKPEGAWAADARWGDKNNPAPRYDIRLTVAAPPIEKQKSPFEEKKDFLAYLEKLPHPAAPLQGRIEELTLLDQAFADPKIILATLIAPGGVGKSALTDEWLARSAEKNHYNGVDRVFGWSFYSQGAHTTATTSAPFFDAALPFFGHTGSLPKDEAEKGRLLIHCLEKQSFLLILDGLEPLQHPVHSLDGELHDTALKSFFIHLRRMSGENRLILLSSRQPLFELENWRPQNFRLLDLQTLPPTDGAALLRALGAQGPKKELKDIARRLGGHALALVLTGRLVKNRLRGDIRRLDALPDFFAAPRDGDHARRVMREYERLYPPNSPQRTLLALMGLFDRPMEEAERLALCERADLAKPLAGLDPDQLEDVARDLERAGLILAAPAPRLIWDCHPLVRAYFGRHKQEQQAQLVLFEYFQSLPDKQQPDTLEELEPLYRAVIHGCLAGKFLKAMNVYNNRILRGGKESYSLHKLGAHARDLNALAGFFPQGWEKPVSAGLSEADRAWLLAEAAFCLMSLGRLAEAVRLRRAGLELSVTLENWKDAANCAENLTALYLPLGQLDQAREAAEQAISHADRAGDAFGCMIASRVYLAMVLHRQGDLEGAQAWFAEAEVIHAEDKPQSPRLYGVQGAWHCALLLDRARDATARQEVLERGQYALKIAEKAHHLLSIAFDHLTLGRVLAALRDLKQARPELDAAVRGMRRAGKVEFMPEVLLTRARLLAETDPEQTRQDLEEADGIIQRCGMKLYAVDSVLLHARLALDGGERDAARAYRQTAEKLIQATGYRLRTPELRSLSADLAG
ncbi:MAG: hypothetical protein GY862_04460 [Gammaproteobacteria bacterium]|nr:hypothetical protein [Gammaproteobacteria bacterium]